MIHSLLINRKRIIEVGMTEGSEEQDLLKALDSVADAATSVGGVPSPSNSNTSTPTFNIPTPNVSGAIDSPFPPLIPETSSTDQLVPPSTSLSASISTPTPLPDANELTPVGSSYLSTPSEQYGIVAPTISETPVPTPIEAPQELASVSVEPLTPAPAESSLSPATDVSEVSSPDLTPQPLVSPEVSETTSPPEDSGPLASIKKDVLIELRPLVDKLNISPEDKFDTLLLLIRNTDDSSLIEAAHEAAKGISDEARRAEALLEIVKEIDYLTRQKPEAA